MTARHLFVPCPTAIVKPLKALLFALPLLAASVSAPALASDQERWFEVEIIAFARSTADSGREHWPYNVQLRYPSRWRELKDPEALDDQPEDSAREQLESGSTATGPRDPLMPRFIQTPDLARDPYLLLPQSSHQLRRHAEALRRDSRFRVLFHQSWRQPVFEQDLAPALLINAGNAYGSHHELEGSILLYLSRFLHLQTNLWFSEFEVNYGQRPDAWPTLPQHPARVAASPVTEQSSPFGVETGDNWNLDLAGSYLSDIPGSLGEPYLPKRIVTLQQSRRMRSGELHYIDHPLIGLIVQVTPYERPSAQ